MKIEISQWWLSIQIDYILWVDIHVVSAILIAAAIILVRKAINWWRWRGADNTAEYFVTEDGWDKL
jgi:hypothetical protein